MRRAESELRFQEVRRDLTKALLMTALAERVVALDAERRRHDETHRRADDWRRDYLGHPRIAALSRHLRVLAQAALGKGLGASVGHSVNVILSAARHKTAMSHPIGANAGTNSKRTEAAFDADYFSKHTRYAFQNMPDTPDKLFGPWIWDAGCSLRGAKDAPAHTRSSSCLSSL
jgi:hypothetical protein